MTVEPRAAEVERHPRSSTRKPSTIPWFGYAISVVLVALLTVTFMGYLAVGDDRFPAGSGGRGASTTLPGPLPASTAVAPISGLASTRPDERFIPVGDQQKRAAVGDLQDRSIAPRDATTSSKVLDQPQLRVVGDQATEQIAAWSSIWNEGPAMVWVVLYAFPEGLSHWPCGAPVHGLNTLPPVDVEGLPGATVYEEDYTPRVAHAGADRGQRCVEVVVRGIDDPSRLAVDVLRRQWAAL